MAGLLKIVHWMSHKKRTRELNRNVPSVSEKHVKGRFGLNMKLEEKNARKNLKAILKNSQNYHMQMYSSQYEQKCDCRPAPITNVGSCSVSRRAPLVENGHVITSNSPRSSISSSRYGSPSPRTPPSSNFLPKEDSIRPKDSEITQSHMMHSDKKWQDPNDGQFSPREKDISPSPPALEVCTEKWTYTDGRRGHWLSNRPALQRNLGANKTPRCTRPPNITKAKTLSVESRDFTAESLCATWPPAGKGCGTLEEIVDESECTDDSDQDPSTRSDCNNSEEALREWYIPFVDLEFKERLRHGRNGDIYRGQWYGEVLIYTLRHSCDTEMNQFMDEVAQMGMIRHENIVLFMGACMEPPRLAVITSMRKGPSLFEYLHLKRHRLPFHSKLNIARQIAQGMGYLHAKGIAHKKLKSKNIILESRVKLCIMDYGMENKDFDRNDYGCIPRGHLSYISPELISSLQIEPPKIFPTHPYTQQSDIYAFGSLLYELLAEKFPFHDQHPHAIIWQVASGKRCSLHNFRFINGLKTLIKKCWSQNPQQRPPFSEIVQELQQNVSHHKRHSSSEPDRLHYTGQSILRNICT